MQCLPPLCDVDSDPVSITCSQWVAKLQLVSMVQQWLAYKNGTVYNKEFCKSNSLNLPGTITRDVQKYIDKKDGQWIKNALVC